MCLRSYSATVEEYPFFLADLFIGKPERIGDSYGAVCEIVELTTLLYFAAV